MLGTAAALLSLKAFAGEEPADSTGAPPTEGTGEASPSGSEPTAPAESASPSEPTAASGEDEMFTGTRFRWGISALGGPFVGG